MELIILENKAGTIRFNKKEIMEDLKKQLKQYDNLVMKDESEVGEFKVIRANLNKVAKTLDDRRKEIKKEYSAPLVAFEKDIKECISLIDDVNSKIDAQVKEYEERKREEKEQLIKKLWEDMNLPEVKLNLVFNQRWLNTTFSEKNILEEMNQIKEKVVSDLETLERFTENKIEQAELKYDYLKSLDLAGVIKDYTDKKEALKLAVEREKERLERLELEKRKETVKEDAKEAKKFKLQFEVIGTREEMEKLSAFLKENSYEYKKI